MFKDMDNFIKIKFNKIRFYVYHVYKGYKMIIILKTIYFILDIILSIAVIPAIILKSIIMNRLKYGIRYLTIRKGKKLKLLQFIHRSHALKRLEKKKKNKFQEKIELIDNLIIKLNFILKTYSVEK